MQNRKEKRKQNALSREAPRDKDQRVSPPLDQKILTREELSAYFKKLRQKR